MANNTDPVVVATAEAAQRAAEAAAAAQRQMYDDHPGVGVSSPDQDPEYRRLP
jgi:hypothetical protein